MGCLPFKPTRKQSFSIGWSHQPGLKTPLIRVGATNQDKRVTHWFQLVAPPEIKCPEPLVRVGATNRDKKRVLLSRLVPPTGTKGERSLSPARSASRWIGIKVTFGLGSKDSRNKWSRSKACVCSSDRIHQEPGKELTTKHYEAMIVAGRSRIDALCRICTSGLASGSLYTS